MKSNKAVKEEFRSLFVDSGTDLVIPERQTSDSRRVWKMKPIWSWIESTISQTRQEVIEEAREKILELLKRIKLEFDVCVCDCGAEWKDTDGAELVNSMIGDLEDLNNK